MIYATDGAGPKSVCESENNMLVERLDAGLTPCRKANKTVDKFYFNLIRA